MNQFVSTQKRSYFNVFYEKQLSIANCFAFKNAFNRHRVENLSLSTHQELVSSHNGSAINALSIDKINYRYLLCGGLNGSLSLFDLECSSSSYSGSKPEISLSAMCTTNANTSGFSSITSVQWYPEDCGLFIASNLNGELLIYDTSQFIIANQFTFSDQKVYCAKMRSATESAGPLTAVGLDSGIIHLCDLASGDSSHILEGHKKAVSSVDWSPIHSFQLCSASADGTIRVWDIRKGGTDAGLLWLDWRQDHTTIAKADEQRLQVDSKKKPSVVTRDGVNIIQDTTASKQYRHLSTASYCTNGVTTVGKAHDQAVMSMRYTPDGNYILSVGNDQRLRLWSAHTGALQPIHYDIPVSNNRVMPYQIEIMQVTSHSTDDVIVFPDQSTNTNNSASSNSGDVLLVPLHSADGKANGRLKGHLGPINCAAYRKPLQSLITAGKDGLILMWEPKTNNFNDSIQNTSYEDDDNWSVDLNGADYVDRMVDEITVNNNSSSKRNIMQDINRESLDNVKRSKLIDTNKNNNNSSSNSSNRNTVSSDSTAGEIDWNHIEELIDLNSDDEDDVALPQTIPVVPVINNAVNKNKSKKKPEDRRAGIFKQLNKRSSK